MTHAQITLTGKRLTTPRAAALAGILFAVMMTTSVVLIRLALPVPLKDGSRPILDVKSAKLALGLMPFAGIAFLWFVGVVRDRLGQFEDQFFSTVFYGSGLLFLAMTFCASAVAGAIIVSHAIDPYDIANNDVYRLARAIVSQFFTIYALRMAGVFVISLGTIWLRTKVMPRWLSFITYLFALILILSTNLNIWMVLVFPGWVFLISVYILIINLRRHTTGTMDGLTVDNRL